MKPSSFAAIVMFVSACSPRENESREIPQLELAVVDVATGRISAIWEAPDFLVDVAVDPATSRVWGVANSTDKYQPESLGPGVWELYPDRSPELRYRLRLPDWWEPDYDFPVESFSTDLGLIAIDATNRRATFTAPVSHETVLIDLDTGARVRSFLVGNLWHGNAFWREGGIGYSTGGTFGWAFRSSDGDVYPDDPCVSNLARLAAAVSYVRDELYVIVGGLPSRLCVVDLETFTSEEWEIPCATVFTCFAWGIAVHPDGRRLYVTLFDSPAGNVNTLGMLDVETGTWTEVADRAVPHGIAVSPDGARLYVTERTCHRVGVYDAATLEHIADIPLEGDTLGIDLSADGRKLFVAQAPSGNPLASEVEDAFCPEWAPLPTELY